MAAKSVTFQASFEGDLKDCTSKFDQIEEISSELTGCETKESSVVSENNLSMEETDRWTFKAEEEGYDLEIQVEKKTKDFKLFVKSSCIGETRNEIIISCYFLVYCVMSSKRLGPGSKFTDYSHPLGKGILFQHIMCTYYF